ncbi:MAG: DUF2813 domain-containing protein [Gemmatimonadetes bacterium]|nr:DUF2813 domain-containing protein [Gemmatimonadota bacterium]
MFLEQIEIVNFRGIQHLSLKLDKTTVLIGENNTGKSTVLDALQTCLSRSLTRKGGIFSEYDYHLPEKDSQPIDSDAIEITLRFVEQSDGEWPDEVVQILSNAVQIDETGRQSVILRVQSKYDDSTEDFVTNWDFLDLAGETLINAKAPRHIIDLQRLAPVFYLAALRDSAQEFRPYSQFWGPFVRSLKIDPDLREELEEELAKLNQRVLGAHESFGAIKARLGNTAKMVPLDSDEPVGIEAIPGKVFDILSRTQVMLTSTTGARLPIGRHGEGTQSLAVICLFDAFLQSRLKDSYTEYTTPILALEEPEAHLHPSAIRLVADQLQALGGQQIIATHSGDLVASIPLSSLRRLRRKDGKITFYQIENDALTNDEIQKLDYHVRSTRGSLLFARCWLLVEGETDSLLFEECARISGYDLVSEGVSCIAFTHVGVGPLIKLADQLGIEWLVVADDDPAGNNYIRSARRQIDGRSEDRHLHKLEHGDLEVFLCIEGYGPVYEASVSPQKKGNVIAQNGTLDYWKQVTKAQPDKSKPQNVVKVIEQIESKGKQGIPTQIRRILRVAIEFAKETL